MPIITLDEALLHVFGDGCEGITALARSRFELFVRAANEWLSKRVTDTRPAAVKLAALFLVDHLWTSDQDEPTSPCAPLEPDDEIIVSGSTFAIPIKVTELIEPWTRRQAPTFCFPAARAYPDPHEWRA